MPTVLHRLARWAEESPDAPAQRFKKAGQWHTLSSSEVCDRVYALALFFEKHGITPQDISAILAYNSPEWVQTELAMLSLGAKSAGLYPNSTAKDINYIIGHTEAAVLAVQNAEYFNKMFEKGKKGELPKSVRLVLCFDHDTSFHPGAISYGHAVEEGMKMAREAAPGRRSGFAGEFRRRFLEKLDPNTGAFLIYTSGTTGNPKGVLLSHDNLAYTSDIVARYWKLPFGRGSMFSFLPLCHVAEKIQNVGVSLSQRYLVSYATKFENVASEIVEAQPTLLLCVPRLWEKMMEGVTAKIAAGGTSTKARLARWALGVGERLAAARYGGRAPNPLDVLQWPLAQKLVISKVRHALGLEKAELLASGAAPLPAHVSRWFRSLGLEILEDYGQSESTAVICMTEPGVESAGTVGRALPGTEFKIAEDGEVLTKGRHVFLGYFKDEEATRATLVDGWLHTGDLAVLNERGQVQIRGRKKEIMKTSGGKMIAPAPLEEKLKAHPMISQACLVGDNRKYLSALITLSEAELARVRAKSGAVDGDVITDPELVGKLRKAFDDLNSELASYEQIKRFTVIAREFSIEDGEMTPTLKMKRNVIESRFRELIDRMYA